MRIATWNIERLKHQQQLNEIIAACNRARADILILTETDIRVQPDYPFGFHTSRLDESQPVCYKPTENRVSIYTNYPCISHYSTYDEHTALCVELDTEKGNLIVYGTIIGIYGNKHENFRTDLPKQIEDFNRLSSKCHNLCICGDFNLSFSDGYYYTKTGHSVLSDCFSKLDISILTAEQPQCIDHIAVSNKFTGTAEIQVEEWNQSKELSDHKGIVVEF